ncbi:ankyrin repeat-containing protein NPR4-like [Dioscorea cayenensis subsp. rotundata]|uniref:Ankyrin repeat-containing protein NPR4-like n=1 Tax=Dioscorea cayennensis subsp. rotundata TaxID=55577 RepID=A0AB40B340_DIOCR|nr:ankyrin repeat-containing protein NPR4-like [Dioscorea cayenensis subsp. rotundata]
MRKPHNPIIKKNLTLREFIDIDNAILSEDLAFLKNYVNGTETSDVPQVNLSGDPLLNVMIAYGSKTELLLDLIKTMTAESLEAENMFGDTALHVAAANNRLAVATALIKKNPPLIEWRNKKLETPLLKAALSGSVATFRKLVKCDSNIFCRTISGENVLHYAILGNNPELALEIAQEFEHYPELKYARNSQALTPLQLLVTIPQAFRNSLELGPAESFIYTFIQLNSHDGESKETERNRDEELGVESNAERDKLL